jgi:organic radical activating enzyme
MDGYIGRDLRDKLENPFIFQLPGAAAASSVSAKANGYDATGRPNLRENTALAIEYCKENPEWRLTMQAHKIWDIP